MACSNCPLTNGNFICPILRLFLLYLHLHGLVVTNHFKLYGVITVADGAFSSKPVIGGHASAVAVVAKDESLLVPVFQRHRLFFD